MIDPRMQRRIQAMNDVFGLDQEDVRQGLTPADIASLLGRSVDSVTGAPTRAGVGAAITGEDPVAAASRQFGANPDTAPSFGMVEDVVLDPANLVALGGKSIGSLPARLAALDEVGAIGKFQSANKIGNVLHAKNEFSPLLREQAAMAKANRAALKGGPKAGQPTLAFEKIRMDVADPDAINGMNADELQEMLRRVEIDQNAHRGSGGDFYQNLWDGENNAGNALIDLRDKAREALDKINGEEAEKIALERINRNAKLPRGEGPRQQVYSHDDNAMWDIFSSAAMNDASDTVKRMFVDAFDQGKYRGTRYNKEARSLAREIKVKMKAKKP